MFMKKENSKITPWEVSGKVDYEKLIREFGISPMKNLPKEFNDNVLFRRKVIFAQRDFDRVVEAIKNKVNVISQAQLQGELMDQFETNIAVCGCHGKTTTSSLLVYALNSLKQRPSYLVGVPFFSGHQGGDFQGKKYFPANITRH